MSHSTGNYYVLFYKTGEPFSQVKKGFKNARKSFEWIQTLLVKGLIRWHKIDAA